MSEPAAKSERTAILWALGAILLWGTLAAVVGDALKGIRPTTLVLWAFAFATPVLVGIELLRGRTLAQVFRARPRVVLLGLWGIFGYHALLFAALDLAPVMQANLL